METSFYNFAESLYAKIVDEQNGHYRNTCFSPYSIYTALCCTLCGCSNRTEVELLKFLQLSPPNNSKMHSDLGDFMKMLVCAKEGAVTLSLANKVFLQINGGIKEEFVSELRKHYSSEVEKVNFEANSENCRRNMNEWAANLTQGKIAELFPQGSVNKDTRVVLGNALYFRGGWEIPFRPAMTRDEAFHVLGGGTVQVKMMRRSGLIPYVDTLPMDAQAIKLKFADERWDMLVMLPKSNGEFPEFVKTITKKGELEKVLQEPFYEQNVNVKLPRFKLSMAPGLDMKQLMKSMGVEALFDRADLEKVSSDPLFVSNVFHSAVLEVDEKGATAAAATGVMMQNRAMIPPEDFTCDRAFLVAILVDGKNPVFTGHVINPEQ